MMKRLFRFSIFSSMLAITVVAIVLGVWTSASRRQRHAVGVLRELQFRIFYDESAVPWIDPNKGMFAAWLDTDDLTRVKAVHALPPTTAANDRFAAMVARSLHHLETLRLGRCQITDAGLSELCTLSRLKELHITSDYLTSASATRLHELGELQELTFVSANVDDHSIPALGALKQLSALDVYGSSITTDGIDALRKLLPDCQVSNNYRHRHLSDTNKPPPVDADPHAFGVWLSGLPHYFQLPPDRTLTSAESARLEHIHDKLATANPSQSMDVYIEELGTWGHLKSLPVLEQIATSDRYDQYMRADAVHAIAMIGSNEAAFTLIRLANDPVIGKEAHSQLATVTHAASLPAWIGWRLAPGVDLTEEWRGWWDEFGDYVTIDRAAHMFPDEAQSTGQPRVPTISPSEVGL